MKLQKADIWTKDGRFRGTEASKVQSCMKTGRETEWIESELLVP